MTQKVLALLDVVDLSDTTNYNWWIPVSYSPANGDFNATEPKLWLQPTNATKEFTLNQIAPEVPVKLWTQDKRDSSKTFFLRSSSM